MTLSLIKIIESTTVDGPGLRTTVYSAGCSHHCDGCQNPQSWDLNYGTQTPVEAIAEKLLENEFEDVTFSGGDPFYQADAFAQLASIIKTKSNKNIWCYTGYTFEYLISKPQYMPLLKNVDVLVDGPFVAKLKDKELLFRGSANQRLIDIRKSLDSKSVVEYSPKKSLSPLLAGL